MPVRALGHQYWYGETDVMQVTYRDRDWTFDHPMTVTQMLKLIKVPPKTVLVIRNGQLIADDLHLSPGDLVKVVSVISGG